jgi:hypothetical protein
VPGLDEPALPACARAAPQRLRARRSSFTRAGVTEAPFSSVEAPRVTEAPPLSSPPSAPFGSLPRGVATLTAVHTARAFRGGGARARARAAPRESLLVCSIHGNYWCSTLYSFSFTHKDRLRIRSPPPHPHPHGGNGRFLVESYKRATTVVCNNEARFLKMADSRRSRSGGALQDPERAVFAAKVQEMQEMQTPSRTPKGPFSLQKCKRCKRCKRTAR